MPSIAEVSLTSRSTIRGPAIKAIRVSPVGDRIQAITLFSSCIGETKPLLIRTSSATQAIIVPLWFVSDPKLKIPTKRVTSMQRNRLVCIAAICSALCLSSVSSFADTLTMGSVLPQYAVVSVGSTAQLLNIAGGPADVFVFNIFSAAFFNGMSIDVNGVQPSQILWNFTATAPLMSVLNTSPSGFPSVGPYAVRYVSDNKSTDFSLTR